MFTRWKRKHAESRARKKFRRECPHPDEFHSFPLFEPAKDYHGPGTAIAPVICNRCGAQIRG